MGSHCSQVPDMIIGVSEWRNIEIHELAGCDQDESTNGCGRANEVCKKY